jgi:hypothetical protein
MNYRLTRNAAFYLAALILSVGCGDDDTAADRAGVGAECSDSDDCYREEQICLLQFKGGYCGLADCTADDDCPAGSACVAHDDGTNYCFRICVSKAECNRNRSVENEANCSADVEFVSKTKEQKACVPPSSGDKKK